MLLLLASIDYTVEPGDTVSHIAQEHDVSTHDLIEANDIRDPDLIIVGQVLVIPQSEGQAIYHVVQSGETLSEIAKTYGTTAQEIADINGFPNPNLIYPGNRLLINGEPPDFEPAVAENGTYRVRPGDNLARIARAHGTTVAALAEANGITDVDLVYIDQMLQIPGTGWHCPVPGATFMNDWGFPRNGGRFHEGNDLYAPEGTPVIAPVPGVVEHVDGTIGGLQFWLNGDDGVLYIGSHMSRFGSDGRVAAGTVVGHVGTTGNARGSSPHLHFEIHPVYNDPINPYPVLSEACG